MVLPFQLNSSKTGSSIFYVNKGLSIGSNDSLLEPLDLDILLTASSFTTKTLPLVSEPYNFPEYFPSTRRLLVQYDDTAYGNNMNPKNRHRNPRG